MSEFAEPLVMTPGLPASMADNGVQLVSVLEDRVSALVERHRDAQKLIEELTARVGQQDAAILQLRARIEEEEKLRANVRDRVGRLIDTVTALADEASG